MPAKAKAKAADPLREAAVDYFAGRSHDAWRKAFHKNNPAEKAKPRMRERGGLMVDVNQPWSKLHPNAKADNLRAARDAYAAVKKYPNDREAASEFVHVAWMKRNKNDASQPKALFKPYSKLPEVEKDKDRAHVDTMKRAIAAVSKPAPKKSPRKAAAKPKPAASGALINIDARAYKQLQAAAKQLSKALGREVPAEALLLAGVQAMTALSQAMAAQARRKS
jgi:hypothetical protein